VISVLSAVIYVDVMDRFYVQ